MAYDLELDDDGDLLITAGDMTLTEGLEAIRQDAMARLQFFKGEWFLDEDVGMPFFQSILVKNPDLIVVTAAIRSELQNTPGISEVTQLAVDYDHSARTLTVTWRASTDLGEIGDTTTI